MAMRTNIRIIIVTLCAINLYSCATTKQTKLTKHDINQFNYIYNQARQPFDIKKGPQYLITNITHDTLVYDRMINEYYPEMIFSREDTIELRKRNVRKKQRNELYTFVYEKPLRASYNVIYPYQIDYVEIYPYEKFLLNKKTGKPLHGIYKIYQSKKKYSIGYYFYGRPCLPWLGMDSI